MDLSFLPNEIKFAINRDLKELEKKAKKKFSSLVSDINFKSEEKGFFKNTKKMIASFITRKLNK